MQRFGIALVIFLIFLIIVLSFLNGNENFIKSLADHFPAQTEQFPSPRTLNNPADTAPQSGFIFIPDAIFLENRSKYYKIELPNEGKVLKTFLSSYNFWNNTHLYLQENGTYFSAKDKSIRLVLSDELQDQNQLIWGDINKDHFVASSIGVEVNNREITFTLFLDQKLKQKASPEGISYLLTRQLANRILTMLDTRTAQEEINKIAISKNQLNFFNVQ